MPKITDRRIGVEQVDNGFVVRESWREEDESAKGADAMFPETRFRDKEMIAANKEQVNELVSTWIDSLQAPSVEGTVLG